MKTAAIICTFNGEKFISEELDSILNQNVKLDKIFIADDSSKDNTAKILKSYKEKFPELIDFYINETNLGYRKNFETVLQKAKDYDVIFFADQDDIWLSNKTEMILKEFEANKNLVLAFSDAEIVEEDLAATGKTLFQKFLPLERRKILDKNPEEIFTAGSTVTGCTMAISNRLIEHVLPFSETLVHDEWITAIAFFSGEIKPIYTPLLKYRIHAQQSVGLGANGKTKRKDTFEWINKLIHEFSADEEIEKIENSIKTIQEIRNHLNKMGITSQVIERKYIFLTKKIEAYSKPFFYRLFFGIKNYVNGNYKNNCFNLVTLAKDIFLHKKV